MKLDLTPRQAATLGHLADGHDRLETAKLMGLEVATVNRQVTNARERNGSVSLACLMYQLGLMMGRKAPLPGHLGRRELV